jgi:hypothetical protein
MGKAILEMGFSQEIDDEGIHCIIDIEGIEVSEKMTISWNDLINNILNDRFIKIKNGKYVFDSESVKDLLSYSEALILAGEQISEIVKDSGVYDNKLIPSGLLDQCIQPYKEWVLNSNLSG